MATRFGQFLEKRAINKSKLGEKTGITRQRLSELSVRENSKIRLDEACAIAKALGVDMNEICKELGES
jgi:DNA-binding Xre family transcriptional regulator